MNRDGTPPDDETPEAPPADNVIAFPGARVRAMPEAPAEAAPGDDAPDAPPEPVSEVSEPGMTLDAFERAVRSAVREKLGGEGGEPPAQGADELVAQVFSALTGKDAKSALAEVRQRLAEPLLPSERLGDGDVIDLSAVREARQKQSLESASKIGNALKDTFAQFLAQLSQRPGASNHITLDATFFRQHGGSLLGHLFQGLAGALMQQAKPPEATPAVPPARAPAASATEPSSAAPPPPPEGAPPAGDTAAPPAPPAPNPQVQVRLDLGSILAGLFRRRDTPPSEPPQEPPKD